MLSTLHYVSPDLVGGPLIGLNLVLWYSVCTTSLTFTKAPGMRIEPMHDWMSPMILFTIWGYP